jgi:hypothetical protein
MPLGCVLRQIRDERGADNYIISLTDHARLTQESAMLLLAAGLAIDAVFKEK